MATEKRLIDANALEKRFDKRIEWLRLDVHDKYSLGLYHGAATDKDLIGEIPTVDAVEVVRCKNCKRFAEDSSISPDFIAYSCGRTGDFVNPFDYCSYGERRTDHA